MKKIGMMLLLLFVHGVEGCLYAMKKPVEVKPQVKDVKDVKEAPPDVQARAKQYTDLQNKAYKTDQAKTDAVTGLYNVDSSVTPTFSGTSKEQMSINLSDTTQIESTFDGWNGKLKESRLTQFKDKNKKNVDSRIITTLKSNGELTEAMYKNFKLDRSDGPSKISTMIEYKKDGSFTITNYAEDGKTPIDITEFTADLKSNVESQPLTPEEQGLVTKLEQKAIEYANDPNEENRRNFVNFVIKEMVQRQGAPVNPEQQKQLEQIANPLLSEADTTNPNWFTNFVKIISDAFTRFVNSFTRSAVDAVSQGSQSDQVNSSVQKSSPTSVNLSGSEKDVSAVPNSSISAQLFPKTNLPGKASIKEENQQAQTPESPGQSLFSESGVTQRPDEQLVSQSASTTLIQADKTSGPATKPKKVTLKSASHAAYKRSQEFLQKGQNLFSSMSFQAVSETAQ